MALKDFTEVRKEYDAKSEQHQFVFSYADSTQLKDPVIDASENINFWFSTDDNKDSTANAPIHLKNYTLVSWDKIRYYVNEENIWLGRVTVLDTNKEYARQPDEPDFLSDYSGGWSKVEDIPDFDKQNSFWKDTGNEPTVIPDAKILRKIGKPVRGKTYWVRVSSIFNIGQSDYQEGNTFLRSDVVLEKPEDLKELQKDWRSSPDNTMYKEGLNYYVHINTYQKNTANLSVEQMNELYHQCIVHAATVLAEKLDREIKPNNATAIADFLIKNLSLNDYKGTITPSGANRPNSFLKILVRIPRSFIDCYPITPKASSTHVGLFQNWKLLEESYKKVIKYFNNIDSKVKEQTIRLDMAHEARLLSKAWSGLESMKKTPFYKDIAFFGGNKPELVINDTTIIKLGFNRNKSFSLEQIEVSNQMPSSGDTDINQKLIRGFVDLEKTGILSNDIFKCPRTMIYLMNLDIMAQDIDDENFGGKNKWIDFLFKYTYQMPDVQISNSNLNQINFRNNEVTSFLNKIDKELYGPRTLFSNNRIMREINPEVRGLLADVKRNVFSKIESPKIKKIFETIDGVNSLESLYNNVLNKLPIDKILEMGRTFADPIAKQKMFEKKAKQLKSQQALYEGRLEKTKGKKDIRNVELDFSDDEKITDLTGNQPEMIKKAIEELFIENFCNVLKNVISTIRRNIFSPTTVEDTKSFGELDVLKEVKENQEEIIKNLLNSMPQGKELEIFDVRKILNIISENCVPREIVALSEGEAPHEVLEILGYLIAYEYPILAMRLDTIYDIEEFLVLLLSPIKSQLIQAAAKIELQKEQERSKATYCSPDYEEITNHLLDRFHPDLVQAAINGERESRDNFLALLNDIDGALNEDINNFVFGGDLDEILNSIMTEDEASSYMSDMVIESFFSPFINNFSIEALNISTFYLEPRLVDKDPSDSFSRSISPPELTSRTLEIEKQISDLKQERNSLDPDDQKNKRKELKKQIDSLEESLSSITKGKKVSLGLKDKIEFLKNIFADGLGTWQRTSIDPVIYKMPIPLTDEDPAGTSSFIELRIHPMEQIYQIDPDKPMAYDDKWKEGTEKNIKAKDTVVVEVVATLADQVVINNSSVINTKGMDIYDFISTDDAGHTVYASAFSNILKEQIKDLFPDFIYTEGLSPEELEDVGNTQRLEKLINDFKTYLFDLLNQQLVKLVSKEASKSSFFKQNVLSQMRLTTLPGDENLLPAPRCGETFDEEIMPPGQENLFPELFDLTEIVDNIKRRKVYFEVLQKTGSLPVSKRTSLENAIIFESLELFLKIFCIEFLLSGIFVYGEIDVDTILKEKNNFKILQDTVDFSITSFGEDFEDMFYSLLLEYAALRQDIPSTSSAMTPMPVFFNSEDEPEENIDDIMRFCLTENLRDVFPVFQSIIQTFSESDKLSANELIDIIPSMDVAYHTVTNEKRFDFSDEKIKDVYDYGGIILEKYIKAIYSPPAHLKDEKDLTGETKLYEIIIENPQKYSSYVKKEDGSWEIVEGDTETGIRDFNIRNFLKDKNQELSIDADPTFLELIQGSWNSEAKKKQKRLEYWLETYSKGGATAVEKLNIPGFSDLIIALNSIDYSELKGRDFYKEGSKTGVVNLRSFAEMQEQINTHNSDLIEKTINKQTLLQEAADLKNNFLSIKEERDAQLEALNIVGKQLDKYLLDYLDNFRNSQANSGKDYITPNGTFSFDSEPSVDNEPRPWSDKVIFEWVSSKSPFYQDLTKILDAGPVQKSASEWWGLEYPGWDYAQKYWLAALAFTVFAEQSFLLTLDEDDYRNRFISIMTEYFNDGLSKMNPFYQAEVMKVQEYSFINPVFGDLIATLLGVEAYTDTIGFVSATKLAEQDGDEDAEENLIFEEGGGSTINIEDYQDGAIPDPEIISPSYYDGLKEYYENRVDPHWRKWKEVLQGIINPPEKALEKFNYWDAQRKITEKRLEWFAKNFEQMNDLWSEFLQIQENLFTSTAEMRAIMSQANANLESDIDDSNREYEIYTDPTKWFDSNLFLREHLFNKAKEEEDKKSISGNYKKYFQSLRYGVRISYVFPNFENMNVPFGLQHKLAAILPNLPNEKSTLKDIKDNLDSFFKQPYDSRNIFNKAFKLEEKTIDNGVSTTKINLLPMISYEEDIDNFFFPPDEASEETPPKELEGLSVSIENSSISSADNFPFGALKQSLMETEEYKRMFSESLYYGELINCLGLYSSITTLKDFYYNSGLGIFSGAKTNIKNIIEAVNERKDFRMESSDLSSLEKMKNNFLSLTNVANNPGNSAPDKTGYAAVFAAKTALKVLKGVVETTDPAIIQGKKIQTALVNAIKSTGDISKTLEKVTGGSSGSENDTFSQAEQFFVNDAMLGPVVFIGVRPFPPIPLPVGNPVFPLTAAGATYLALTTAMSDGTEEGFKVKKAEKDSEYCVDE